MLTLEQMSDRLEIQQLLVDYATAIDSGRFDDLDRVFTPDAHIDYSAMGGTAGAFPDVKAWLASVLPNFPAYQHLLGNVSIVLSGDTATAQSICMNPMQFTDADGSPRVVFFGLWYDDTLVRTADGWRISSRTERKSYDHNVPSAT